MAWRLLFPDVDMFPPDDSTRPTGPTAPLLPGALGGPPVDCDAEPTDTQSSLEEEWVVRDRLPRVGSSLLVGPAGAGKSRLAREIALCVMRGRPWRGFSTRRGPVLYAQVGASLAEIRDRFVALNLRPGDDLHVMKPMPTSELLHAILERAKSLEPALIVIDGLHPLLHAAAFSSDDTGQRPLDRVLRVARDSQSHLLLVHDLAKPASVELSLLLGRNFGGLDTILMLSRVRDQRLLRTIQQRGQNLLEPIVADSVPDEEETRRRQADGQIAREILEYLWRTKRLTTARELCAHVSDGRPLPVARALHMLQASGRVIQTGAGTAERPHRYTGCDRPARKSEKGWLRPVRPWASLYGPRR